MAFTRPRGLYVAVNVSDRQVKRGLVRQVDEALSLSGLDPSCVELEITEQSLVDNIEASIAQSPPPQPVVAPGFTSRPTVKRLPIENEDRHDLRQGPAQQRGSDAAIAMTIVSLAQGLNMRVAGRACRPRPSTTSARPSPFCAGLSQHRPVTADRMTRFLAQRLAEAEEDNHWPNVSSALSPITIH